jgi:hypothetical protein
LIAKANRPITYKKTPEIIGAFLLNETATYGATANISCWSNLHLTSQMLGVDHHLTIPINSPNIPSAGWICQAR